MNISIEDGTMRDHLLHAASGAEKTTAQTPPTTPPDPPIETPAPTPVENPPTGPQEIPQPDPAPLPGQSPPQALSHAAAQHIAKPEGRCLRVIYPTHTWLIRRQRSPLPTYRNIVKFERIH